MNGFLLSSVPIWMIYGLILIVILAAIRAGVAFGKSRKIHFAGEDHTSLNTMVGATLGLLAFILAFTFNLSSSRFEARKLYLLEEVNSIETSWLRSELVPDPYGVSLRESLKEYVETRLWLLENTQDPESLTLTLTRSQDIQNRIWGIAKQLTQDENRNDEVNALLIDSINEVFDNQTRRVAVGTIDHIPTLIWVALILLIVLSMFEVGYLLGKADKINWVLICTLSLAFSIVIMVIVDLEAYDGFITINNQVMYDLYDRISGN